MTRSDVLRDLYEALEMLDARQQGLERRPAPTVTVDLRDDIAVAGSLRHEVRSTLGTDWDRTGTRW